MTTAASPDTLQSITLPSDTLRQLIQQVIGAIEIHQTKPIYAHILLELTPGHLQLTATDGNIELRAETPVPEQHSARFTLPAKECFEITKALPSDSPLTLTHESGGRLVLSAGKKSRFQLTSLDAQSFPQFQHEASPTLFTLAESQLLQALRTCKHAMAQTDVRYYLNGMLWSCTGNDLTAVATDGHRLALQRIRLNTPTANPIRPVIPRKSVLELVKLLGENEQNIEAKVTENTLVCHFDNVTFATKLIEASYPDYRHAMPSQSTNRLSIDTQAFREALSRIAILSSHALNAVVLELETNQLRASTVNNEKAANELLHADYQGDNIQIAVNIHYMMDVLNQIKTASALLYFTDNNSSILITAEDDDHAEYVVMPLHL